MSKKRKTDFFRKSGGNADQALSNVDAQSESTDTSTPKNMKMSPPRAILDPVRQKNQTL